MVPRLFPTTPMMDFFAGLVPGMSHLLKSSGHVVDLEDGALLTQLVKLLDPSSLDEQSKLAPPQLKVQNSSLGGFNISDMAISHLQDNQLAWPKHLDEHPDQVLLHVLEKSVMK
jgi:hypothetical protein